VVHPDAPCARAIQVGPRRQGPHWSVRGPMGFEVEVEIEIEIELKWGARFAAPYW
jgi:hypothetical protein